LKKTTLFFVFIVLGIVIAYDFPLYYSIIALLFAFVFKAFIDSIGKKIGYLEIISAYATLLWLVGPVIAYAIFNEYDNQASLWESFMPMPANDYFAYALPGTMLFVLGLRITIFDSGVNMTNQIKNIKSYLSGKSNISITLISIGLSTAFFEAYFPVSIRNVVSNISFMLYIGLFYAIYSSFRRKGAVLVLVSSVAIAQSILSGMFGTLIFLTTLSILIFLSGKKVSLFVKVSTTSVGIFIILLMSSIKGDYRKATWSGLDRSGDSGLYWQLIVERLLNPSQIFSADKLYLIAVRVNQGQLVAKTMQYVPQTQDYVYGQTIVEALASALVPRFVWKDKPLVGGGDKACRFLGDCESSTYGNSFNITPLGEAYVNFGQFGGAIFMFFYGLLFNFLFNKALQMSIKRPTIILWLPLVFISFFTMENDIIAFTNTFAKSSLFVFFVFVFFQVFFKIKL
jgi:hypothetical protein